MNVLAKTLSAEAAETTDAVHWDAHTHAPAHSASTL